VLAFTRFNHPFHGITREGASQPALPPNSLSSFLAGMFSQRPAASALQPAALPSRSPRSDFCSTFLHPALPLHLAPAGDTNHDSRMSAQLNIRLIGEKLNPRGK
jgi:hypothetical protein